MTEDGWKGKDQRLYASNWHSHFNAKYDNRAKLTWKNRFIAVTLMPKVINFYSPGEDVAENPKSSSSSIIWDMTKNRDLDKGAWGHQEMIKGGDGLGALPFARVQGGWGTDFGTTEIFIKLYTDFINLYPEDGKDLLQKAPIFKRFLEQGLFGENGSQVAAEQKVQYDLLTRGIPAMSYPVAANVVSVSELSGAVESFNMEASGRDKSSWPAEGHDDDRRGRWIHSDFKNVALPYVYPMYQKMITEGALAAK